ncbi:hypothetical protein RDI58_010582 [Solanum bulbocastanum]|uniref:Uncharacterized protein n=1 Tax=Solanum bulbocastanum TaxID=147425 RepID=A0AAN8YGW7_SOLBU
MEEEEYYLTWRGLY